MAIAEKYQLRSGNLVLDWVKAYHERDSKKETRNSVMRRNHTMEERLKAVLSCLDGGERPEDVAQAHQIEVQTLRSWVKKYREMGAAGLEDRRGQRLAEQLSRDKEEALRIENARLKQENELLKMAKKSEGTGEGGSLRRFRQERQYEAVRCGAEEEGFPIGAACRALHISRAGYYQWRSGKAGARVAQNQCIAQMVKEIHQESPDKGYRRIRDDLDRYYHTSINDKRALRICRCLGIHSTIKRAPQGCTRAASSPRHLAENVLKRRFCADRPNHRCDRVSLLCGSHHAQALSERHSGSVRPANRLLCHPGYQRRRAGP